jgi:hypothetical protein
VARRCTVCDHTSIMAINLELTSGDSDRAIASRYGLNRPAVERHKRNHLRPKVQRALAKRATTEGWTYAGRVAAAFETALGIMEGTDNPDQKLRALDRVLHSCEIGGKFSGEIVAASVREFVAELGLTEAQVKRLAEDHKALDSYSWEDGERDAVDGLRLIIEEHPERAGPIRLALFGEVQVEEE